MLLVCMLLVCMLLGGLVMKARSSLDSHSICAVVSSRVAPLTTSPWFCMITARGQSRLSSQ